jgi:antitoxin component of MazEF toxin-antitoxin module
MKLWKTILLGLLLCLNFAIATPALADKPKFQDNPDYLEITDNLNQLFEAKANKSLPEGLTSSQVNQKIARLQLAKYIIENGEGSTECRNETGKSIAVYGSKTQKNDSNYDNVLYLLPDGQTTDEDWNCEGVYLPNDVKVAGLDLDSAVAVKVLNGTKLIVKANPDTGVYELNLPPVKVFKAGEANWDIPDLTQASLDVQYPKAPVDD